MKIKRKPSPVKITFSSLIPGNAFLYDNSIYIKTHKWADGGNAVKLQTGSIACFGENVGVDNINVEIVEV